ncbi:MAG: CoA-binding protein [Deltaproteobacteria bacterium]|nr:CoA-binding protein [Deltaproteobacteria bacterium]
MGNKNLDFLFRPASIAVVGASAVPGKISSIILESLKNSGYGGKVFLVNPGYESIGKERCYPSIASIGEEVDLALYAIPAAGVAESLREAAGRVKGAVIIGGGFGEAGEQGRAFEKEIKDIVRKEGVRVVGPNCMGVYDTVSRLDTFFVPAERVKRPSRGGLSIISQSGSFAVTVMDELAAEGIGVARVVSYGNRVDVNESDCLDFLAADEHTKAVAVYMESVDEGRRFVESASRCSAVKPVMAVKVGRHDAGVLAARSHTGAIAGRYEIYRAAFRKAGVIELEGYEDFMDACKAYGTQEASGGNRVMIITDGGGMGVSIADACSKTGLEVPPLSADLADDLRSVFPPYFSVSNPMDLTGSATDALYAEALEKTMGGEGYDMAIVAALWGPPGLSDGLPALIAEKAGLYGKPVIICSPGGEFSREKTRLFRAGNLPVFSTPESAARAASALAGGAKKVKANG